MSTPKVLSSKIDPDVPTEPEVRIENKMTIFPTFSHNLRKKGTNSPTFIVIN